MEVLQVDAVVDDMQFLRRQPEAARDVVPDHRRIADHGAQRGMAEHLRLGAQSVAMPGAEAIGGAPAQIQPGGMDAVAGAIDVAAGNALMALHQVEAAFGDQALHGARKAGIAPGPSQVERRQAQAVRAAGRLALPLPRDHGDIDTPGREGGDGTFDEALGAAEGRVLLAHDGKLHGANSSSQAASTCATGKVTRQSLTLESSQPARPQGRHG